MKNKNNFYKNVFILAGPIALQSFISIGVNMLDTIMVGKLGDSALSATSLANSFISIYHILCMGLGMGASVLVSRYWGMQDNGENEEAGTALKQTVSLMLRLTLILALIFMTVTLLFPAHIMQSYTDKAEIVKLGVDYLGYSFATFLFLGLSLTTTIALRSVGQVRLPLYTSFGALFINLGANYILIFGKLGAPQMGVAGAALATLLSRIFEASIILGYLFFFDKRICFKIRDLMIKTKSLWKEYIRISIPVLISDSILAFGNNAVSMVIGHLSEAYVAANAVVGVTQQLSTVVIQGVSQAGAITIGKTMGTGDKNRAMDEGRKFLFLGIILGVISAGIILVIKAPIIAAYDNLSKETIAIANELMICLCIIIVFQATNSIMTKGVLRGGGDTIMLMVTDNIFLWICSIPLGILAGFVFKWPAFWIYFFLRFDQIIKTIWCVFRLRSGKWLKKISTGATEKKTV